jgi:hypothetical protein
MKSIKISDETHNVLSKYCEEHGYKINSKADKLLSEYLDLLALQEKKGMVWIEK